MRFSKCWTRFSFNVNIPVLLKALRIILFDSFPRATASAGLALYFSVENSGLAEGTTEYYEPVPFTSALADARLAFPITRDNSGLA